MENKTCLNWNHQPNMVFYGTYLMIIAEMIDWIIPSGVLKHGNGTSTIDIYSWGNHLLSMSRGFAMGCPIFSYDSPNMFWAYFSKWNLKKPLMTLGTSRNQLLCFPVMLVWLPAPPWCFWLPRCFPCDGLRNPNLHGQFIPAIIPFEIYNVDKHTKSCWKWPSRNSWFTH